MRASILFLFVTILVLVKDNQGSSGFKNLFSKSSDSSKSSESSKSSKSSGDSGSKSNWFSKSGDSGSKSNWFSKSGDSGSKSNLFSKSGDSGSKSNLFSKSKSPKEQEPEKTTAKNVDKDVTSLLKKEEKKSNDNTKAVTAPVSTQEENKSKDNTKAVTAPVSTQENGSNKKNKGWNIFAKKSKEEPQATQTTQATQATQATQTTQTTQTTGQQAEGSEKEEYDKKNKEPWDKKTPVPKETRYIKLPSDLRSLADKVDEADIKYRDPTTSTEDRCKALVEMHENLLPLLYAFNLGKSYKFAGPDGIKLTVKLQTGFSINSIFAVTYQSYVNCGCGDPAPMLYSETPRAVPPFILK